MLLGNMPNSAALHQNRFKMPLNPIKMVLYRQKSLGINLYIKPWEIEVSSDDWQ